MPDGGGGADAGAVLAARELRVAAGALEVGPLSLRLAPGEALSLRGPSGAGKSTLLRALALLVAPSAGSLALWGRDVSALGDGARAELRRQRLAVMVQGGNLVGRLGVAANVTLQARLAGETVDAARLQAALAAVDLTDLAARRADRLSGGEAARVAVARLIYQAAPLVLADEPTAALDPVRATAVTQALVALRDAGSAVVVATHDATLAATLGPELWLGGGEAPC